MANFWLVKSEPSECSIDHVRQKGWTLWDGVRNYQARNNLRAMKLGDLVLYYHSVEAPVGVVGIVKVKREAYPDPTQFDSRSEYYDPKSSKDNPRWSCPDFAFVEKFQRIVTLEELKGTKALQSMALLQKGSRLSVHQVKPTEFQCILSLSKVSRS
jgi:predicted RNA-binding protein with PUA-like domain